MSAVEGDEDPREVTMYCDGACRGNPGPGGYAVILLCEGHEKHITGVAARTTNNRMELSAAIAGLEALKEPCRVQVITDSQYLKRGMTEWIQGWIERDWTTRGKPVRNRELWERLLELSEYHDVRWEWVRGHRGDRYNELCDRLANQAVERYLGARPGPGAGGSRQRR